MPFWDRYLASLEKSQSILISRKVLEFERDYQIFVLLDQSMFFDARATTGIPDFWI